MNENCQYEFSHTCGGALFCMYYQQPSVPGWTHWSGPCWICSGAMSDLNRRGVMVVQASPSREYAPILSSYASTSMNIDTNQQNAKYYSSGNYYIGHNYNYGTPALTPPEVAKAELPKSSVITSLKEFIKASMATDTKATKSPETPKPKETFFFCSSAIPPKRLETLRVPVMSPMEGVTEVPYVVSSAEQRNYERHEEYMRKYNGNGRIWHTREPMLVAEDPQIIKAGQLGSPAGLQCRLCGGALYKYEE